MSTEMDNAFAAAAGALKKADEAGLFPVSPKVPAAIDDLKVSEILYSLKFAAEGVSRQHGGFPNEFAAALRLWFDEEFAK
jgi:hypothetical protein